MYREPLSLLRRFSLVSNLSKPSILGKRVITDAADLNYTTGRPTEVNSSSPASNLPQDNLQDIQGKGSYRGSQRRDSQYEESKHHRCRQRVTFTGVTPTCNDENIEDCIVIANTIQVEMEPTDVEEMQSTPQDAWQDESNLETHT